MRLLACILVSLVLHVYVLTQTRGSFEAPTLSISAKTSTVDLKIRPRAKKAAIAPLVEEIVEPTPPPLPEPTPKPLPEPIPKEKIQKKKEKRQPLEESPAKLLQKKQERYVSDPVQVPRKVERAEYLNNPPPEYPVQARRRRQEGVCTLLVDVKADGTVSAVVVKRSSGYSLLDAAAKQAVAKWRFSPAVVGNRSVESRVIVPILFQLKQ